MASRLYGATLMGGRMAGTLQRFDAPVREMHAVADAKVVFGRTDIDRGRNFLSRVITWLFGFPGAGRGLPTAITIVNEGGREIWHRRFAGEPILTLLEPGSLTQNAIVERFRYGVAFDLDVQERSGMLRFEVIGMRIAGIPIPRWAWPKLVAQEREDRGGFRFDIDIGMPWIGRLIRYRGWVSATPPGRKIKGKR